MRNIHPFMQNIIIVTQVWAQFVNTAYNKTALTGLPFGALLFTNREHTIIRSQATQRVHGLTLDSVRKEVDGSNA